MLNYFVVFLISFFCMTPCWSAEEVMSNNEIENLNPPILTPGPNVILSESELNKLIKTSPYKFTIENEAPVLQIWPTREQLEMLDAEALPEFDKPEDPKFPKTELEKAYEKSIENSKYSISQELLKTKDTKLNCELTAFSEASGGDIPKLSDFKEASCSIEYKF